MLVIMDDIFFIPVFDEINLRIIVSGINRYSLTNNLFWKRIQLSASVSSKERPTLSMFPPLDSPSCTVQRSITARSPGMNFMALRAPFRNEESMNAVTRVNRTSSFNSTLAILDEVLKLLDEDDTV